MPRARARIRTECWDLLGGFLGPCRVLSAGHGAESDPFILQFHSNLFFLAHLYLETRRSHIISLSLPSLSLPPSLSLTLTFTHEPRRPPSSAAHRVLVENPRACPYPPSLSLQSHR